MFAVPSSCPQYQNTRLLMFCGVVEPRIYKNTLNTAKLATNLITYMSIQHIWNLSWQLGLCSCCKLANISWNFITTKSNIKHARVISTKFINFYWNLPRKLLQNQPFCTNWFSVWLALNIPAKSANFSGESVFENLVKFDFFSRDLLEAPRIQLVENDCSLKH